MRKQQDQYYIIYERDGKRGYIASAPAIPGCVVYGETIKEAYKNISFAIRECLEVISEFNKKFPKETVRPEMIKNTSFVSISNYAEA